jgi:hypothetical protein
LLVLFAAYPFLMRDLFAVHFALRDKSLALIVNDVFLVLIIFEPNNSLVLYVCCLVETIKQFGVCYIFPLFLSQLLTVLIILFTSLIVCQMLVFEFVFSLNFKINDF